MKGSDRWGQEGGRAPRIEIVLGALVLISLVGVYFYIQSSGLTSSSQTGVATTVSTTGIQCSDDSMPQTAQDAEQDPSFANLSNGLCYNYLGESPVPTNSDSSLSFAYYNGTITYPCGTSPQESPASEIQVVVTPEGGVVSAQLASTSASAQPGSCDPSVPVQVVSVQDVESTIPAVPQLNLTLTASPADAPVTNLRAVLTLDGGSQTFRFSSVTSASPLRATRSVSVTEIILSGVSFSADEVYPMTISGAFDNGQTFGYTVHVQIAQVP
jgi:hypothetical protein